MKKPQPYLYVNQPKPLVQAIRRALGLPPFAPWKCIVWLAVPKTTAVGKSVIR